MNSSQEVDPVDSKKQPEIYQNGCITDKDVLDYSADSTINDLKYPNSGVVHKKSILKMVLIGVAIAAIVINIILAIIVIVYVAADSKHNEKDMQNGAGALGMGNGHSSSTTSLLEVTATSTSPSVPPSSNPPTSFTMTLPAVQDVWLESGTTNFNFNFLIIGKHPGYPKKRSLLQFQNLPSYCTSVASAKMYIWYWYSHKASWQSNEAVPLLNHIFKVHQVKKEWIESQATSSYRKSGVSWSQPYLGLDGTDANAKYIDSVYFPNPPPSGDDNRWIEFDITEAAQNWANGQPNYGVVVWSNRENDSGRDVRFYSRERSSNKPYMRITCSG